MKKKIILLLTIPFAIQAQGIDYKNEYENGSFNEKCQSFSLAMANKEIEEKGIKFKENDATGSDDFYFYTGIRAACAFGGVYAASVDSKEKGLEYTLSAYLPKVYESSSDYLKKSDVILLLSKSYYFGYNEKKMEMQ